MTGAGECAFWVGGMCGKKYGDKCNHYQSFVHFHSNRLVVRGRARSRMATEQNRTERSQQCRGGSLWTEWVVKRIKARQTIFEYMNESLSRANSVSFSSGNKNRNKKANRKGKRRIHALLDLF